MKLSIAFLLTVLTLACGTFGEPAENKSRVDDRAAKLSRTKEALIPFFKPMTVQEGDWLESHPEDGETFEEYVKSSPTLPTAERKTIYIQPIGDFSAEQRRVIEQTAEYMRAFYNLPVVLRDRKKLEGVPFEKMRVQYPNNLQIRTNHFLDDVLPKMLPGDAAALICFTSNDLYPGDTWNYVFGQASLEGRVGVWSLWRLGKEGAKSAPKALFLSRTLKIAMHETGHMFSMKHCKKYECLMSGVNHLAETDRRPTDTCPECTAKIAWAMNYKPLERYERLAEFWKKQKNPTEEKSMLDRAKAVGESERRTR